MANAEHYEYPNQYRFTVPLSERFSVPLSKVDRAAAQNCCKLYAQRLRSQLVEMLPDYSVKQVLWGRGQSRFDETWTITAYRRNFCGYQVVLTLDLTRPNAPVVSVSHWSRKQHSKVVLTGIAFFTIAVFGRMQFYKMSLWLLLPAAFLLSIAFGGGFTWLILYPARKKENHSEKSLSTIGQRLAQVPMDPLLSIRILQ